MYSTAYSASGIKECPLCHGFYSLFCIAHEARVPLLVYYLLCMELLESALCVLCCCCPSTYPILSFFFFVCVQDEGLKAFTRGFAPRALRRSLHAALAWTLFDQVLAALQLR